MRAHGCLKRMAWPAVVVGGLLCAVAAEAQDPRLAQSRPPTATKPGVMRPPAVLSAARPDEGHFQVPQPGRLTQQQVGAALPMTTGRSEVGTGIRPAAYQDVVEGQPYYPPMNSRVEQLPAPVGALPLSADGVIHEQWPGGRTVAGQGAYYTPSGYGPQAYGGQGYGSCNPACDPGCMPPPLLGLPCLSSVELIAGVQGFTGSLNRGAGGSFGFHEGAQIGIPVCGLVTAEFGVLTTQNNFEGNGLTADDRSQLFLTAGGFRRVDWGLQGGLVFDYLHEEWDYEIDLAQLRGELSYVLPCGHDVGFWFTVGVNDSHSDVNVIEPVTGGPTIVTREGRTFHVDDLFAFFYRRQFACGGEGRLFGGFTSESAGLFGGDFRFPINPCWAFEADFLYVGAQDTPASPGYADESWNVSMQVVWTPWSRSCGKNYDRPLLGVANNGSFVTKMQ
jgi:hypothetical protein